MLVLALALSLNSPLTRAAHQKAAPPNVIFILADDLGINDLGCYGRKDHHTPHLDKLASQGVRCTSAYCAQPICSPSRAAIMTGKTPARLHLTTFLPGRRDAATQKLLHPVIEQQVALIEVTLAERLKAAGYATACIGKWHLGGPKFGPNAQGFDTVYAGKASTSPTDTEGGKGEYDLTAKAIEFVTANRDRPFFLYLPHNTPHIPLAAKKELVEKHKAAFNPVYAAVIESMDDCVGKLLAAIDELKLTDNTLVVFASDNGGLHVPELKESAVTHNTPFRAGKGFVYEGGLRVPTIVRFPGKVAPAVIDTPFVNTDWTPTILEACGLTPAQGLDGVSVWPMLTGKPPVARDLYWHFPHYTNQGSRPTGAVRSGNWKCVEQYEGGSGELYDLAKDVGEATNIAAQHPDVVKGLRDKLAAWRTQIGAQANAPNPAFDAAGHRKLYVDVDVSKVKAADANNLGAWRTGMNEAVKK